MQPVSEWYIYIYIVIRLNSSKSELEDNFRSNHMGIYLIAALINRMLD